MTPLDQFGRPLHVSVDESQFAGPPLKSGLANANSGNGALRLLAQPKAGGA